VTSLIKKIADGDLQLTNWDTYRYASLNLGALKQFGSLEVRTMRGTYDPEFINEWAQGINSIFRRAAEEFKSPVEVFDYYYGRSQKDFLSSFVPDAFVDRLSSYDGWNERLDRNHFNLAHIVYDTDWDRPDKEHPVIEKISYNDILATSSLRSTLRQNWTDWQVDDENRDPIHEISLDDDVEKVIESLVSWSSDNFSATPEQRMKIKLYISERYLGKRESHRSNLTDGRRQDSTQVWDSTYQEWVSISSFHVNVAEKFETEFLCDEGGNYLYSEPSDFEEPEDSLDPFTTTEFTPNADLVMAEPQPQQGQLAFQDLSFWEGYTNDLQNLQTIRPVTTILPTEETF
jgi:hypothetical protein